MWPGNPLTHTLSTTFQNIIISWIIHSFICHLCPFIPSFCEVAHSLLVSFIHTFSLISINSFITSFIHFLILPADSLVRFRSRRVWWCLGSHRVRSWLVVGFVRSWRVIGLVNTCVVVGLVNTCIVVGLVNTCIVVGFVIS